MRIVATNDLAVERDKGRLSPCGLVFGNLSIVSWLLAGLGRYLDEQTV